MLSAHLATDRSMNDALKNTAARLCWKLSNTSRWRGA
jgi:hypothetical protein